MLLQVIEIFVEVPAGTLNGKKPVIEKIITIDSVINNITTVIVSVIIVSFVRAVQMKWVLLHLRVHIPFKNYLNNQTTCCI